MYLRRTLSLILVILLSLTMAGCGTPVDAIETFKPLHQKLYVAWEMSSVAELESILEQATTGPFLEEQIRQQTMSMKARLEANEKHKVEETIYHTLKVIDQSSDEFTIYADYTIKGYRDHGDIHELQSSHRVWFHVIETDAGWRINEIRTP